MSLWIMFALMAASVGIIVLVALRPARATEQTINADLLVYSDQLATLEADLESGQIETGEAETAKIEISRRLLAAGKFSAGNSDIGTGIFSGPTFPVFLATSAVLLSLGVYALNGNPDFAGVPFAGRQSESPQDQSIPALLAQIEEHLAQAPEDGQGWELIAPIYLRLGRFNEAVRAFANAGRILGANAPRLAGLGVALVGVNGGTIIQEARQALVQAVNLDPTLVRPRLLLIIALEQDGNLLEAREAWQSLLRESAEDAPWREAVTTRLAALEERIEGAPGPDQSQIDAAGQMSPEDRQAMVTRMVGQLAARLEADGGPLSDWMRLVRSYMVLQQEDEARAALANARAQYVRDEVAMEQIAATARSLSLEE